MSKDFRGATSVTTSLFTYTTDLIITIAKRANNVKQSQFMHADPKLTDVRT